MPSSSLVALLPDREEEELIEEVEEGYAAQLSSPLIQRRPDFFAADETVEYDEEEEKAEGEKELKHGISQELKKLLEQSVPRSNHGPVPFFMQPSKTTGQPVDKKPSLLAKLLSFLTFQEADDDNEPLIPQDLLPKTNSSKKAPPAAIIRRASSATPLDGAIRAQKASMRAAASMDQVAQMEQAKVETVVDNETILQHKYRECMRQARTMVNVSFAQLKSKLSESEVDVNRFGDCLYLLPLNELGRAYLMTPKVRKVRVGRNEAQLFNTRSRVISRHQGQIFSQLNKVTPKSLINPHLQFYILDVGSNSGSYVNGERLSESGKQSAARELESFDILQFGVDYTAGVDQETNSLPLHYKAPQFLVLIGAPLNNNNNSTKTKERKTKSPIALKPSKLEKLRARALTMPVLEKMGGFRLYFEFGDVVGENTSGWAILLSKDLGNYTFVFNNYQLSW